MSDSEQTAGTQFDPKTTLDPKTQFHFKPRFHPKTRFYLGSYTKSGGHGIGRGRIDPVTGRPGIGSWTATVDQPSWLDVAPDGRTLYAVSELSPDGLVTALRLEGPRLEEPGDREQLRDDEPPAPINRQPTGAQPAHLTVHPSGKFLFASLYDGGGIAVHPIADDGSIEPRSDLRLHSPVSPDQQAHAHQVVIDPSGQHLLAVDLGLDTVFTYRLDAATGRLAETGRTVLAPGSGPRHLVFHPDWPHVYVVNELDSTVTTCRWVDGTLIAGQVVSTLSGPSMPSALPATADNYPGEIAVYADGRFVYVSNRGTNTIAVFVVEDGGAGLRLLAVPACGGDWPRHLALAPSGTWLYSVNERSGDITWFPVDSRTGLLGPLAGRLPVPAVTQLLFL